METGDGSRNHDPTARRDGLTREALQLLVTEHGPLTIAKLREAEAGSAIVDSAEFQAVASRLDWPNEAEDGAIRPTRDFDDEGFRAAIMGHEAINNFPLHLFAHPAEIDMTTPDLRLIPVEATIPDMTYGCTPYLLRAYAIAPEFMTNLHDTIRDNVERHRTGYALLDADLRHDMHIAYLLLGRLMKTTDVRMLLRSRHSTHEGELIVDAHDKLIR